MYISKRCVLLYFRQSDAYGRGDSFILPNLTSPFLIKWVSGLLISADYDQKPRSAVFDEGLQRFPRSHL